MREIEIGSSEEAPKFIFLSDYFGLTAIREGDVDLLCKQIAIYGRYPEWGRGIRFQKDLPRWVGGDLSYRFTSPTGQDRINTIIWVVENLNGGWNIDNRFIRLDSEADAVQYKLTHQ